MDSSKLALFRTNGAGLCTCYKAFLNPQSQRPGTEVGFVSHHPQNEHNPFHINDLPSIPACQIGFVSHERRRPLSMRRGTPESAITGPRHSLALFRTPSRDQFHSCWRMGHPRPRR